MKKGRMWILHIDAADGENVWFGVKMLAPFDDNASPGKARRYETRRQFDGPVITRQRLLRLAPEAGNFTLGKMFEGEMRIPPNDPDLSRYGLVFVGLTQFPAGPLRTAPAIHRSAPAAQ